MTREQIDHYDKAFCTEWDAYCVQRNYDDLTEAEQDLMSDTFQEAFYKGYLSGKGIPSSNTQPHMSAEQIDRLAGEGAEEESSHLDGQEYDRAYADSKLEFEKVIDWLLRKHLIVEKSEVINAYKSAKLMQQSDFAEDVVCGDHEVHFIETLFDKSTFNPTEK